MSSAWRGSATRTARRRRLARWSAPGQRPLKLRLNQQENSDDPHAFHSLGQFDFPAGASTVILSTEGADGFVHADAVQLLKK